MDHPIMVKMALYCTSLRTHHFKAMWQSRKNNKTAAAATAAAAVPSLYSLAFVALDMASAFPTCDAAAMAAWKTAWREYDDSEERKANEISPARLLAHCINVTLPIHRDVQELLCHEHNNALLFGRDRDINVYPSCTSNFALWPSECFVAPFDRNVTCPLAKKNYLSSMASFGSGYRDMWKTVICPFTILLGKRSYPETGCPIQHLLPAYHQRHFVFTISFLPIMADSPATIAAKLLDLILPHLETLYSRHVATVHQPCFNGRDLEDQERTTLRRRLLDQLSYSELNTFSYLPHVYRCHHSRMAGYGNDNTSLHVQIILFDYHAVRKTLEETNGKRPFWWYLLKL